MHIINTALCSFGMSGKVFHAPFIHQHCGFNLYGVLERTNKSASGIYPNIKTFESLESMLADARIDLVVVNTPNYTHYDFAKKALLAGKHVLVEKAFTVTVSEAEDLIMIAESCKKKIAVYQNRRYDSDFKTVKKIATEGVLGKIIEASICFERFNPNLSLKQHKETPGRGAGLLYDLGPHIIDQAINLFGMPESLSGFLAIQRPHSKVDDYTIIQLFYPGLIVHLKAGLLVKEPGPAFTLHGTKGSFIKLRADVQEEDLKQGKVPGMQGWGTEPGSAAGKLNIIKNGETYISLIPAQKGNYLEYYDELYMALINNTKLPVSAKDGLMVIRIIEAVLSSQFNKKEVAL